MSINWNWKDEIGVLKVRRALDSEGENIEEFFVQIYEGNADLIMIYNYEENGQRFYTLYNFFCDLPHLKRCIENNVYIFDEWQHITFYKWTNKIDKLAKELYKIDIQVSFVHTERSKTND